MVMLSKFSKSRSVALAFALAATIYVSVVEAAKPVRPVEPVTITSAKWESGDGSLVLTGENAGKRGTVEIFSVASGVSLDTVRANREGKWTSETQPAVPPCNIRAESHGTSAESAVLDAPADCDGGTGGSNLPPTANDDEATTIQDVPVDINVIANDTDSDGSIVAATMTIVTEPNNGSTINNGDGTATYTPGSGQTGTDSFTYTVQDGSGYNLQRRDSIHHGQPDRG
jgi:hypothetical protein